MAAERRNNITRPFVTKSAKDAGLLRDAWDRADQARRDNGQPKLSQKELAGKHKVTPGMISHYITGTEPLNVKWQLRFADYIGVSPGVIWPDFPHKNLAPGAIPPEAADLALDLLDLNPADVDTVRILVRSLGKKKGVSR